MRLDRAQPLFPYRMDDQQNAAYMTDGVQPLFALHHWRHHCEVE
jgi:hypothetical protein